MFESASYIAVPPGETIKEQLEYKGMTQKEFAARMDMSEKHISKLINGEVHLTQDVAIRLEFVLGPPARFWNGLEALFREKLAKVNMENSMAPDIQVTKNIPYKEMVRFGWVSEAKNTVERVEVLRRYFELVNLSLLNNPKIMRVACRSLDTSKKSDLALLAWIQEARLKSREIETKPIQVKKLLANIKDIKELAVSSTILNNQNLKDKLATLGIALVFLPNLKDSFLQGATFLDGKKVVIVMNENETDEKEFVVSLFHELGHVVMGHLEKNVEITEVDEQQADEWARQILGI